MRKFLLVLLVLMVVGMVGLQIVTNVTLLTRVNNLEKQTAQLQADHEGLGKGLQTGREVDKFSIKIACVLSEIVGLLPEGIDCDKAAEKVIDGIEHPTTSNQSAYH